MKISKVYRIENTETLREVFEVDEETGEKVRVFFIYGKVWEFLKLKLISDEYKGHEYDWLCISSDGYTSLSAP